jgi:hypothetical protein
MAEPILDAPCVVAGIRAPMRLNQAVDALSGWIQLGMDAQRSFLSSVCISID